MGLGMAHVVYSGVGGHLELQGKLFEGIKFWISQKVPQRTRFVDEVKVSRPFCFWLPAVAKLIVRSLMVVRFCPSRSKQM